MSRRHYREAARIVSAATYLSTEAKQRLIADLITFFADDNPRFSPSQFRAACEVEVAPEPDGDVARPGYVALCAEAAVYYALCDEARALGIPTSLDDPDTPATVDALRQAVRAAS